MTINLKILWGCSFCGREWEWYDGQHVDQTHQSITKVQVGHPEIYLHKKEEQLLLHTWICSCPNGLWGEYTLDWIGFEMYFVFNSMQLP